MWGRKGNPETAGWRRRPGGWEDLIHAYVDDMLPPRQRLEVEEYLAIHPEEARRIADFRNQNRGLHELYDQYLLEPIPEATQRLEERIIAKLSRRRATGALVRAAAAAAVLALVAGGTWYGARYHFMAPGPEIDFAALTSSASEDREPPAQTREEGGAQKADLASQGGTDTRRSKAAESSAPDLNEFGFRLTSSREISQSRGAEAAQLVYESEKGRQVMLYYSPTKDNGRQKITFTQQGPISMLVWNRGGRSFSMIGDVDRDTMLAMGAAVNARWVRPPDPSPRQDSGEGTSPPDSSDTPRKKNGDRTERGDAAKDNAGEALVRPAVSQDKRALE